MLLNKDYKLLVLHRITGSVWRGMSGKGSPAFQADRRRVK